MYLCRKLTDSSLPVIGKAFGGRDHSTVIHSIGIVETKKEKSVEVKNTLDIVAKRLTG